MLHRFEFNLFESEAIASGAILTSGSCDLRFINNITGLALRVVSVAGAADVRVEMQSSRDGENWDDEDDRADITSSTATDRPGNQEGWNVYDVPTPVNNFVRFLIDELASVADTLVSARLICEESLR